MKYIAKMFEFLITFLINHDSYWVDFDVYLHHDHDIKTFSVWINTLVYYYIRSTGYIFIIERIFNVYEAYPFLGPCQILLYRRLKRFFSSNMYFLNNSN